MDGRRQAYTLFEVVVVLAVVVVIGALSLPVIHSMMSDHQVDAAADVVRTHWSQSRSHAISEGRPYRFAYQENSGKFRIAPDSPEFWDESGASTDDSEDKAWILEAELPGKIQFGTAKVGTDANATAAAGTGSWTRVATFLADGTAKEDAEIGIARTGTQGMTIKLRGSTGSVSSGEGPRP
jgi:Tfp pilus assembly protein FimT